MYGKVTKTIVDTKAFDRTLDEKDHTTHSCVDGTDSPVNVIDRINEVLQIHGLSIVEIESEEEKDVYPYVFTITKNDG